MAKIKYRISARATILLGRENVAKVEGALIELIKNCYDADADQTYLFFDLPNETIYIIDNGIGMTESVITNHWMLIGTDNKKKEYESTKNRIKSGEKGIGRFALDRLGSICEMITTNQEDQQTLEWINNWSDFEVEGKELEDVEAELNNIKGPLLDYIPENIRQHIIEKGFDFSSGTVIKITGLRDTWTPLKVVQIQDSLSMLLPPKEQAEFNFYFVKSTTDAVEIIESNTSDDYDYKIEAEFKNNIFTIDLYRNEFDLKLIPKELFERDRFKVENYTYEDCFLF
jgi:hypothetical protein